MDNKSIDFTKPLLLEDESETLSIERLAAIVGGSVAAVRRWMYEEGIIPY